VEQFIRRFLNALPRVVQRLLTWRGPDIRFLHFAAWVLLVGALLLGLLVTFQPVLEVDVDFSQELQETKSPLLDALMEGISWFGSSAGAVISVVIGAALLYCSGLKRAGWTTLATLFITPLILVLKILFDRPRPSADLINVMYKATQQSFPSGHVVFYTVFFGFIVYLSFVHPTGHRRFDWLIRLGLAALIIGVSYSRIYLGAHWLTDVIAGYAVGLAGLFMYCQSYARWLYNGGIASPDKQS